MVRVEKPADRTFIPVSLLIGEPDVRMREGFCHDVRIKPLMGQRKVAIIDDADFLNEEGANCLLKTLEEPPAGNADSADRQQRAATASHDPVALSDHPRRTTVRAVGDPSAARGPWR